MIIEIKTIIKITVQTIKTNRINNMDILTITLPYAVSIGTFIVGLFAGKSKRNNDFLSELQTSIDLLSAKNKDLVREVIHLRDEVLQLRSENAALRKEVEELNGKFSNVNTIAPKKEPKEPKESKKSKENKK